MKHVREAMLVVSLMVAAGCGAKHPRLVPVSGRVTFAGQSPPAAGRVNFQPIEAAEGLPRRPGSGRFGADGRFDVTSFDGTRGLVPGRYRVAIECLAGEPAPEPGGYEKVSYVPPEYRPPELIVAPDDRALDDLAYDVPVKR